MTARKQQTMRSRPRSRPEWGGVFPAMTTQFTRDQGLDLAGTARHMKAMIDAGVDGIVVLGSLGENLALDASEKLDVVRTAVQTARGRIPVIAGVIETSTRAACRFAEAAARAGAAGLMVLPAMVYRADTRETLAHYRAVARAGDLPVICYNNPLAYHIDITPSMFADLADEKRFVAIKESSGDVRRITDLRLFVGDRYRLFCGVDDLLLEAVALGADGWISGMNLAYPREGQQLWKLLTAGAGSRARALELYRWFTPMLHLDTAIKFVQYIKLACAERGFGTEYVRAPRLILKGAERAAVLRLVRDAERRRPRWLKKD
jgi:4-hydroxy-tetrahydrodipicolinate synthase